MKPLTRRERVIALLETYRDVVGLQKGNTVRAGRPERLEMPNDYRDGSYAELERCLTQLRAQDRRAWWHVTERYLRSQIRTTKACPVCFSQLGKAAEARLASHNRQVRIDRATGGLPHQHRDQKRRLAAVDPITVRIETWHPNVSQQQAAEAVDWLAKTMTVVQLPQEVWAARTGDTPRRRQAA